MLNTCHELLSTTAFVLRVYFLLFISKMLLKMVKKDWAIFRFRKTVIRLHEYVDVCVRSNIKYITIMMFFIIR